MDTKEEMAAIKRRKAAIVFAVIAGLLCITGIFGTIMNVYTVEIRNGVSNRYLRTTFDLAYIFKNGWGSQTYFSSEVSKAALSLMTISFSLAAIGFLYVLGRIIYNLVTKQENNFKLNLGVLLVSGIQYVFMSRFALGYDGVKYTYSGTNNSDRTVYLMGWGVILITVGFFLGLAALFLYDYDKKENVINKTSICNRIASIAIFFVGLYGLTNMISIAGKGSTESFNRSFNSFSFISYLNGNSTTNPNYVASKALAIVSIVIGIMSFIGAIVSAFYYIKGAEIDKEKKIVNISTISFVGASLLSNIFMIIAGNLIIKGDPIPDTKLSINLGFTFIVSLVLGIALILIISFSQNKLRLRKIK